jgi:hypothetical protein
MAIERLTGGLTPGDGADPRTFPAIWNGTADDLEAGDYSKVPTGGSAGQVLVKDSGTDYDADWVDGFRVFSHGSTAGATRPDGAAVYWKGSVAPDNGANGDLWYDTTGDF